MRRVLSESKIIRAYVLIWGAFLLGILIMLPFFSETNSQLKYVPLAGFLLSAGSFLLAIMMFFPVLLEILKRYPQASNEEKSFLTRLFYTIKGIFPVVGIVLLLFSFFHKDVSQASLVEVGGKIKSIEVIGQENPSLKILLENSSNEYEVKTFNIPDKRLQEITDKLLPGDFVYILIGEKDKSAQNDLYVQIYGIKTESRQFLSVNEYIQASKKNNSYGFILGAFFLVSGLIVLFTNRINSSAYLFTAEGKISS